jgi:hypothetical protein
MALLSAARLFVRQEKTELFPGKVPDPSAVSNWNQGHHHLQGLGLCSAAAMINYRDI